ncbi:MAG: hypothetical protein U1E67_07110 [Hyphomicrobiales bacterium]
MDGTGDRRSEGIGLAGLIGLAILAFRYVFAYRVVAPKPLSEAIHSATFDTAWFPVINIIGVAYLLFLFWLSILIARDKGRRLERK